MEIYAKDEDSRRYQAACDWFVQLREAAEDSGIVAEWLAWCASDALNREAFERVRTDWQALGLISPETFDAPADTRGKPMSPNGPAAKPDAVGVAALAQGDRSRFHSSMLRRAAGIAAVAGCLGAIWLVWSGSLAPAGRVLKLATSPSEHRSVRLEDGSLVEIAGDSRLEVRMSPHRRDIVLVRGEAYFSVAHDSSRPFIVGAGSWNVRAVGTRFDVRTAEARMVVAVEEGVVELEPPHGAVATVGAILANLRNGGQGASAEGALHATSIRSGQEVAVVPHQAMQVLPIEPTAVASWRAGRLRFAREPLRSVIASIRAMSGKQIELADPELADLRFTGTVFSSAVDAWVMALPAVFPVAVHSDGAKFVITHRVEPQK